MPLRFPASLVEHGYHDGVAPDEWVAAEYAKTRWLNAQYGLADRTAIEFSNGGHTINSQGTFEFLHRAFEMAGAEVRVPRGQYTMMRIVAWRLVSRARSVHCYPSNAALRLQEYRNSR